MSPAESDPPMGLLGARSALEVLVTEAELLRRLAKAAEASCAEYAAAWGDAAGDYHAGVRHAYLRTADRLENVARHLRKTKEIDPP